MSKPFYEAGKYEVKVTSQGFTKAKTGTIQFALKFTVMGKIDPTNPENMFAVTPYERTFYRALTDKTIDYFNEDMESLGVQIGSFTQLDPETEGYTSLAGKVFDATCEHTAGTDGGLQEKWSIARGGTSKPLDVIASSEVKGLDRLFGKHLKKPSEPPPVQRPKLVPAGMGVNDDDIPF